MRRVASIPFISGMLMSINTNAGCSSSANAMASAPLAASPARSNSGERRRTAFMAERNGAWSSTTSTGSGSLIDPSSHAVPSFMVVLAHLQQWGQPPPGSLR